jgi:hypothetical protein
MPANAHTVGSDRTPLRQFDVAIHLRKSWHGPEFGQIDATAANRLVSARGCYFDEQEGVPIVGPFDGEMLKGSMMAPDTRGENGRRRVGTGAAAALITVVVLAAGCSGNATKAGFSATSPTTVAGGTAPTVAAAKAGNLDSSFCQASRGLKRREAAEEKSLLNTPASVEKAENQAVADLPEFQRLAPASLQSAVAVLVTEDRRIFTDLQAVNFNYADLTPAVNKSLQSPQFTQADDQITNYLTHVCGISPNS